MAMVRIRVYAGKELNEDLTEGKGVEVPYNSLNEIMQTGLRIEVMREEV